MILLKSSVNETIEFETLDVDLDEFIEYSPEEINASVYIGGYILKKYYQSVSCEGCQLLFGSNDIVGFVEAGSTYLEQIDRGKMTYPTPLLVNIILACNKFFHKYIDAPVSDSDVNITTKNLLELFVKLVEELDLINYLEICPSHTSLFITNLDSCLEKFARIILNNFSKKVTDTYLESKQNSSKKFKDSSEPQAHKFYPS